MGAYDSFLSRIPNVDDAPETNPELAKRLEQAQLAYKEQFGKELPITRRVSTRKEQKDLSDRHKKGEPGIYMPINPDDYPDKEYFHTDAVDIGSNVPESFLNKFGIYRPLGKRDPVHAVLDPNFKTVETPTSFLTRIPSEEQVDQIQNAPEHAQEEYRPGFYNPNLVAQGEKARRAGGGNLQPIVEGVTDALKSMSLEDWKKESTLANMLKYGVGQMPIVGDQGFHEEGKNKLIESGKSAINALMNPQETYKAISQQEPGQLLGQMVKGAIYDAPLGPSAKPIMNVAGAVAKPVISATGEVLKPVAQGFGTLQESFANAKKAVNPTVSIDEFDIPKQMTGVGAANVNKQNVLNHALSVATPELANDLKLQFKNGDFHLLNEDVLNAHLEADSLPIPIRLTEGQATGSPQLISEERNTRRANPEVVKRLNEQNKLLKDNIFLIKEQVSPDINTVNHVADSKEIIDSINKIKEANHQATQNAYAELKNANGGKFPVNGKQFADNAIKVLNEEDRLDYLPETIKKKLNDYADGKKEMTFNLFENLRTDLASEMRTAERAGEGTKSYALSKVREELENLPLSEEAAQLKPLADKARANAKKDFDLERDNPIYKDVVNGKADTKDLIQKHIFGSKNFEFEKNIELLQNSPETLKYVKSGTLDYMKSAATDSSGNFSTATFNKLVKNLDENGKLDILFGQDAELIRKLGRTGQRIEFRPKGSYVNESNTLTGSVSEKAKSAAEDVVNLATSKTGIPVGTIARSQFKKIGENKKAKESLRPSAGTKLQDVGKE